MFWDIFADSLILMIIIVVLGQLISRFLSKK